MNRSGLFQLLGVVLILALAYGLDKKMRIYFARLGESQANILQKLYNWGLKQGSGL